MTTAPAHLEAPNAEAARGFYAEVLGCEAQERPRPEGAPVRFACVRDGIEVAVIAQAPTVDVVREEPARWSRSATTGPATSGTVAFAVPDVAAATARALALGAERVGDHADDATTLRDPQGGVFALTAS